jgi:hypothetical protein
MVSPVACMVHLLEVLKIRECLIKVLHLKRISEHFERVLSDVDYAKYGAKTYVLSRHGIQPYLKLFSHNIEEEFNTSLSRVCVGGRDGIRKSLSII